MGRLKVLCALGTRPEAVKMAPVVHALQEASETFQVRVLATAQHRELLDQILAFFHIQTHVDLDIMRPNQSLPELTARLIGRLDEILLGEKPDWVLAQGDTTTVFVTALACFYRKIRFAHVEAGLRTGNKAFPFPEEMNRVLAGRLADLHFSPTERARENLLREGIPTESIWVTGNTVVDALQWALRRGELPKPPVAGRGRLLLLTAHRRESFGPPMEEIFAAVRDLLDRFDDLELLFPVHPNPAIRPVAERWLAGHPRAFLCQPLGYADFLGAMRAATLILSDSGGVQEEAPSLGKPVLILRDETERPEAVQAGCARLVGPHRQAIRDAASELLSDPDAYAKMSRVVNPFGDGRASERIRSALLGETPDTGCPGNTTPFSKGTKP